MIWLVAQRPLLLARSVDSFSNAFRHGDDKIDSRTARSPQRGHWLAESDGGNDIYGATLDSALKSITRPDRQ